VILRNPRIGALQHLLVHLGMVFELLSIVEAGCRSEVVVEVEEVV